MLDVMIALAFIGSLIAGIWDLKTSDIPEEIPYFMIALGIFLWYMYSMTIGDFMPLLLSLFFGIVVSLFGWLAYKAGAWGDGDAAILGAIFFMIPSLGFLFAFVFNFLLVSVVYLVIYSLFLGFRNKNVLSKFVNNLKTKAILFFAYFIVLIGLVGFSFYFNPATTIYLTLIWLVGLLAIFFYSYAKIIEKDVFKKKIPVSKLKPGDVLADFKQWRGISQGEIDELKKSKRYVEIKEGVRFTLVFPITIFITWLLGNVLLLLML